MPERDSDALSRVVLTEDLLTRMPSYLAAPSSASRLPMTVFRGFERVAGSQEDIFSEDGYSQNWSA